MSYAGYGQSPQPRPAQVRVDAIGEAWNLFRAQMGTWILATVIYFVIAIVISSIMSLITGGASRTPPSSMSPAFFAALAGRSFGSGIVSTIMGAFFIGGFYRMALKQIRGESISVGDLFSAGDVLLSLIGANILIALITYVVIIVSSIPTIALLASKNTLGWVLIILPVIAVTMLGALTMFVIPAITDQRIGSWKAITTSWSALSGQVLNSILLLFVLGLIMIVGVLACFVGLLFAFPLFPLAIAIVYNDFFPAEGGPGAPTLDMPLPPSTAYYNSRFDMPPPAPGQAPNPIQQQPQAPPPPQGGMPPLNPPSPPGEMPRL